MRRIVSVAAVVAVVLAACGGPDPAPAPSPQPPPPTQPQPQPQPGPPAQPQPPPPPACQLAGTWALSFTRTGSPGGVCSDPSFAGLSWRIQIFDVQATRFSYEGQNVTRGNPISGSGIVDPATCDAIISTGFDGPIAQTSDGRPVLGHIASEFRLRFAGATAVGDGQETFTSFAALPSFPCTLSWRVFGTR